jgi:hypothetical protein
VRRGTKKLNKSQSKEKTAIELCEDKNKILEALIKEIGVLRSELQDKSEKIVEIDVSKHPYLCKINSLEENNRDLEKQFIAQKDKLLHVHTCERGKLMMHIQRLKQSIVKRSMPKFGNDSVHLDECVPET